MLVTSLGPLSFFMVAQLASRKKKEKGHDREEKRKKIKEGEERKKRRDEGYHLYDYLFFFHL